jgi:curved DNA-binding protein CbpA
MTSSLLPYAPERDVYRLLQVAPTANDQEIAAACRRLARAFHPDHNRSPRADEEMQVVNAVRSLLGDPYSRAIYDRARQRFLYHGEPSWPRARRAATAPTWVARTVAPHPVATRPMAPRPASPPVAPFERLAPTIEVLHDRARRAARSVLAAVRGALAGLGPARCPGCQRRVEADFRYCAYCGTWVGRIARLRTS